MALLGGVLVSTLIAQARLTAQWGRADERLEACRLADRLLEGWWSDKDNFPRNDAGTVSLTRSWRWRTETVASDEAEAADGQIVALELSREQAADGKPAVRVEVLLPAPQTASGSEP